MSFGKPKMPKESPEAAVLRQRQIGDLVKLDDEQNIKIKRILNGARGVRAFAGSALTRAAPSNSAGRSAASAAGASPGAGAYRGGGGYGGRGGILP
jgi:hypothetical protein